ncbi:rCG44010 [Rattus norvegicus]|uniref:RCG44010 n=1 Tax=Rattus norvegicus TaxID=10116 RepID=A6J6S8_RAT|nr:rCG44010 [Rattus norvegicus]
MRVWLWRETVIFVNLRVGQG